MQEKIYALAAGLTGAGEENRDLLQALCAAAEQGWRLRLRPGLLPEDCGEVFACAVAFTAAADFEVGRSSGSVESFTAGEISVKTVSSSGKNQAEALRKSAERLMAPYAMAENFCFRGVQG